MENAQRLPFKRKTWPDFARGVCAMCVILFHIPGAPLAYQLFLAPFTVPLFFIVSGYLTKNYGGSFLDFVYYKLLNQVIVKYMVVLSITTFSVVKIARLILHPQTIPAWYWDTVIVMFCKPRALFFSALVLCSVYFYVINILCRDRTIPMLLSGIALALVGLLISRSAVIRWWGWDTALVCECFYLLGYCMKKEHFLSKQKWRPWHVALMGIVYVGAVAGCALLLGAKNALIVVMNNTWPALPATVLLLVTGNLFLLGLSKLSPRRWIITRLISYIGRHSLICFMCGGPIMAYVHYAVETLYDWTHWGFLRWNYLITPVIWLIACGLTLIPCKFSDRFLPELNGKLDLHPDVPRRHPVGTACFVASVAAVFGLLLGLCLNGTLIPNEFYARRYAVRGVDVSSYQGDIDWQTLASTDISFAYIKATEGSGHVDERFQANWEGARKTELAVGAYHFFSFDSPGSEQAANFIRAVPVADDALPPVVDVEFYGDKWLRNPDREDVCRELHALLDALEAHYGKKPVLYSTETPYALYRLWDEFGEYPCWTRNVVTDPNTDRWVIWQYTDRMKLDGCQGEEQFIDMNVVVSEEAWQALLTA